MPEHKPKHAPSHVDVWSVEGRFQHLIFSPRGSIEGLMIDTDGIPTQFVTDTQDAVVASQLTSLTPGQEVVVEGVEAGPSPKGDADHTVYKFERLVSVDGQAAESAHAPGHAKGVVARLNYAKHGAPNGVVLDSGDFVHLRPEGMQRLALKAGDKVVAEGVSRPLATGGGRVVDAHTVNGQPIGPVH
ncbi:MAG: hypothetical protein EOO28_01890 [Comamonadaceae bacterium]|nr:MAG: hypothetical protein EOO28_01890 [Comamonadaceae bacterium]